MLPNLRRSLPRAQVGCDFVRYPGSAFREDLFFTDVGAFPGVCFILHVFEFTCRDNTGSSPCHFRLDQVEINHTRKTKSLESAEGHDEGHVLLP